MRLLAELNLILINLNKKKKNFKKKNFKIIADKYK